MNTKNNIYILMLVVFGIFAFNTLPAQNNNITVQTDKVATKLDNAELWKKANAYFGAEEYQKAIVTYEEILKNGQESAKLYYNLGNAFYKAGDINNAILNYERAKILAPNDENIDFNLKLANQFVVTKIDELPKTFISRTFNTLINKFTSDTWSYISIATFILFLVFLGIFIISRRVSFKRISFWLGIIVIIISGFSFSFAKHQQKRITNRNSAIVFCPRVTVKSSPKQTGTDLFLIYEGLKVEVIDSLNTWKEIKLADGNEGWLPDSCIVKI